MSGKRQKVQRVGLSPHVQGLLNQEERLLKQTLDHITRETLNTIRCITQEQQVISTKLKLLERRLAASQQRSQSVLGSTDPKKPTGEETVSEKSRGLESATAGGVMKKRRIKSVEDSRPVDKKRRQKKSSNFTTYRRSVTFKR